MRRSASVCGCDFFLASEASHPWGSGLTGDGMGTTRVTCAVPSTSKLAESVGGVELDCAAAGKQSASPAATKQQKLGDFMPTFVPESAEERNRGATHRVTSLNSGFLVLSVCSVANPGL